MILGLELRLPYSYDFSKVTSCCKKFVAGSGRFFPLLVQFLKVGILFGGKQDLQESSQCVDSLAL
jgi:hypothetical protein